MNSRFRRFLALLLVLLVGASLLVAFGDLAQAGRIALRIDPTAAAMAVVATLIAYASFIQLHVRALALLGQRWSFAKTASAVIPSTTLGYLANVGGTTGPAARAILFRANGLGEGETAGLFLMQSVASNAFYLLLLGLGLAGASRLGAFPPWAWAISLIAMLALSSALLYFAALIVARGTQASALARLERIRLRLRPNGSPTPIPERWGPPLARLSDLAQRDRIQFLSLFFWGGMDWLFAMATLHFGLAATGVEISFFGTMSALGLGALAGTLSMIPGGTGVMDGTGVGVYVALGAPMENALVAMLLFRLIFFVIPFALGLVVYRKQFGAVRRWAGGDRMSD